MDESEKKRLFFRRQYLLTTLNIQCPFEHNEIFVSETYKLYTHIDLVSTVMESESGRFILLGDIYDSQHTKATNKEILSQFIQLDLREIILKIAGYAGRFVLIYIKNENIVALHDCCGSRKIFYTTFNGKSSISSSVHLLATVFHLAPSTNAFIVEYYSSNAYYNNFLSTIGNYTRFDQIKQLLPNYYFDFSLAKPVRYWPNGPIKKLTTEDILEKSANMLCGFIQAAANRYKLMLPVTSGYDSRLLLAASQRIKKDVFFYLNNSNGARKTADGWLPVKMLHSLNLQLHQLSPPSIVDKDFELAFLNNNDKPNEHYLQIIYNYYLNFSEYLNLPGTVIPIIKALNHSHISTPDVDLLTRLNKTEKLSLAEQFYSEWLKEAQPLAEKYHISIYDMFYLENTIPNRFMQIQMDKDIAQEEFIPYNCRELLLTMLSFDLEKRRKPFYELHKILIKRLWPELLNYPFNPSIKNKLKYNRITLSVYKAYLRTRVKEGHPA